MEIIMSTVNTKVYIQILDDFLILTIENIFEEKSFFRITMHLTERKESKFVFKAY